MSKGSPLTTFLKASQLQRKIELCYKRQRLANFSSSNKVFCQLTMDGDKLSPLNNNYELNGAHKQILVYHNRYCILYAI